MDSQRMVLLVLSLMAILAVEKTDGLIHIVGGGFGWDVPPNGTFYKEWAKPRVFGLGDELVFPFTTGGQTVIQVDKQDFDTCGHEHVINEYYVGPARFKLDKLGGYYFYSDVGLHCEDGQKLGINVVNGPGSSGKFYGRKLLALPAATDDKKAPTVATAPAPGGDAATAPAAGPESGTDTSHTTEGASTTGTDASGDHKPAEDKKTSAAARPSAKAFRIMTASVSSALACIMML